MGRSLLVAAIVAWLAMLGAASNARAATWTPTTPVFFFPDFLDVSASSTTNVWAVGENDADLETPIAQHWDGSEWISTVPRRPSLDDGLLGVAALTRRNVWAVGWQDAGALVEHWTGAAWRVVATPHAAGRTLADAAALSANDIWAVGGSGSSTLIEHWNGHRWRDVVSSGSGGLDSVVALSRRNVWAVGDAGLIEHYNGRHWNRVTSPVDDAFILTQIARVPGTRHMWAVGNDGLGDSTAAYYDGSSWRLVPVPAGGQLRGVTARSDTNVWAAGIGSDSSFVVRWNGSNWRRITGTALDTGYMNSLTRVPHSPELWAVGGVLEAGGPFAAYNP
jgi:hypothetical protein